MASSLCHLVTFKCRDNGNTWCKELQTANLDELPVA